MAAVKQVNVDIKYNADVEFSKNPTGLNASAIIPSTTNFNNNLSGTDNTVQKALDTLDDLTISFNIHSLTAETITSPDELPFSDVSDSNNNKKTTFGNMVIEVAKILYPIGSIYTSIVSTNPATLFGFGTWSQIAGGKVLVGQTGSDADFDTAEETGGNKTIDISHTHSTPALQHAGTAVGNHTISHTTINTSVSSGGGTALSSVGNHTNVSHSVTQPNDHSAGTSGSGGSATQNIMNPYYVVYLWKRTA